jgi:hypothetical protein
VQRLAKDGYLFVTWANHHYTDFAMSWVKRLQTLGLSNFLVGAMDNDILATLARRAIPTFSMQSGERPGRRNGGGGGGGVAPHGREAKSGAMQCEPLALQAACCRGSSRRGSSRSSRRGCLPCA